ncbi:hypothetical protein AAFF_G00229080 [Aldrovandia affinis]|uniref:Uncharacterized protein n=1 Tax=Aldrovandia affinis TaxID=143900 RepID=A0AAD7SWK1_9TELE|nr:hypothetical protein AAFF_G00229080 [Aldrovandia affinis]
MSKLELVCAVLCFALACSSAAPNEAADNTLHDVNPGLDGEPNGTLEDQVDNQENIMTQLLGDYDKVKALSEGSDCRCKCVVRPLSRSACRRIEEDIARAQDFYTVETLTSGSDCKCACIAPPSALNPCEADFRFKKLQEAGRDDIKLSTIMDLLEGSFYGMDLLKLHSITTKLLDRVENIEKAGVQDHTEQRVRVRSGPEEQTRTRTQVKESRTHLRTEKRKRVSPLQRDAAAAYTDTEKKYEERFVGTRGLFRPLLKRSQPEIVVEEGRGAEEHQTQTKSRSGPNGMVIRGITYYKSKTLEDEDKDDHSAAVEEVVSGDGSVDLLIEDLFLKQKRTASKGRAEPDPTATAATAADGGATQDTGSAPPTQAPPTQVHAAASEHPSTVQTTTDLTERATREMPMATTPPATTTTTTPVPQTAAVTVVTTTTTAPLRAIARETGSASSRRLTVSPTTTTPQTSTSTTRPAKAAVTARPKYRISWTESPSEETMKAEPPKNPGKFRGT